jgi:hypothetical protein
MPSEDIGITAKILRRDFLNGVLLGGGAALLDHSAGIGPAPKVREMTFSK